MIAGGWLTGGGPLDGRVAGLRVHASPAGAMVSFRHLDAPADSGHLLAVALDGELYELVPSENGAVQHVMLPGTLTGGEHRVDVVPVRPEARRLPVLYGTPYGRRVYLRWPVSESEDLGRYLIYSNGGDGEVDYGAPVAVVDEVEVHAYWFMPGTGVGSGRLSVRGAWSGPRLNKTYLIEAQADQFRHNVAGEWSGWQPIERGVAALLDFGVVVVFEDAAAAYEDLVFAFHVGPRREWVSGELAQGTWSFSVRGGDRAGNLSAPLAELPLAIIHLPDPVRNLRAAFDPELPTPVVLTWDLPPGGAPADIEVYTNYSTTFGRLLEEIIEHAPWETISGTATSFAFNPPVGGLWRFLVRTRDAKGRRSDNVQTAQVDTAGPPSGIRLNAPEQVTVSPGPAGSFLVSWAYRREGGEDVQGFSVFEAEVPFAIVAVPPAGGAVSGYSAEIAGPYIAPQAFVVAAVGPGGVLAPSDGVEGIPDDYPPLLAEPLEGTPN